MAYFSSILPIYLQKIAYEKKQELNETLGVIPELTAKK